MKLKERFALWVGERVILNQVVKWAEKALGRPLTRKEQAMFKNWKTTVAGWLGGLTGGTAVGWTTPDGKINYAAFALALLMGLLGSFAKDHNVTGGSVSQ